MVLGDPVPSGEGLPTPESVRHAVTRPTIGEDEVFYYPNGDDEFDGEV